MGPLRLLLAFIVLAGHVRSTDFLIGGAVAVKIFYLISGFLISSALMREGAYRDVWRFYLNRALRIYPVYFVVLVAAIALAAVRGGGMESFNALGWPAKIILLISNVALFGQDWVMFLQQGEHGLSVTPDFTKTEPQLWTFLIDPPAWSLGVELTFYLVIPFFVGRLPILVGVALTSFSAQIAALLSGYDYDPWTYRFFPFEIWVFCVGALSQQILLPFVKRSTYPVAVYGPVALVFLAIFVFSRVPLPGTAKILALVAISAISMPALSLFGKDNRWMNYLGELSYPLYICHWPIFVAVSGVLGPFDLPGSVVRSAIGVSSITGAALLYQYVARPVEKLRRQVRGGKPTPLDKV